MSVELFCERSASQLNQAFIPGPDRRDQPNDPIHHCNDPAGL
jgi:hypothetical protein